MTSADEFAGNVLIATGCPLFAQAYGLGDRENEFRTAYIQVLAGVSGSDVYCGRDAPTRRGGKVRFDDSVRKYLTNYPNQEVASKVTILKLLNRTAVEAAIVAAKSWHSGLSASNKILQKFAFGSTCRNSRKPFTVGTTLL